MILVVLILVFTLDSKVKLTGKLTIACVTAGQICICQFL